MHLFIVFIYFFEDVKLVHSNWHERESNPKRSTLSGLNPIPPDQPKWVAFIYSID
jgi:hypothetical protein